MVRILNAVEGLVGAKLKPVVCDRLAVITLYHDFGKAVPPFQSLLAGAWPDRPCRHDVIAAIALDMRHDDSTVARALAPLEMATIEAWFPFAHGSTNTALDDLVCLEPDGDVFDLIRYHHGRPHDEDTLAKHRLSARRVWDETTSEYSVDDAFGALRAAARACFPKAFSTTRGTSLTGAPSGWRMRSGVAA